MEKIKPSDLKTEAERLVQAGKMPSVEDFLAALETTRDKYGNKILEAQNPKDIQAGADALGG